MGKYKRKYKQGKIIRSVAEFEQCESNWYMVKFGGMTDKLKPMHISFLTSWQYHTLYRFIKNGCVFEAVENNDSEISVEKLVE